MATNDIIDLDQLLEEYESGALAIDQDAKTAEEIELQNLSKYGYKPVSDDLMTNFFTRAREQISTDEKARQTAINRGILADDPYFIENFLMDAP